VTVLTMWDCPGILQSAKVFISILGDAAQQKKGLTVLQRERKHLQALVWPRHCAQIHAPSGFYPG